MSVKYFYKWCTKAKCTKSINKKNASCGISDRLAKNCPFKDQKKYISRINIPGTGTPLIKVHSTDFKKSLEAHLEFEKTIIANGYTKTPKTRSRPKPKRLIEMVALYIDWMKDMDLEKDQSKGVVLVRRTKRQNLSKDHIKQSLRYLKLFLICLKEKGINPNTYLFNHFCDDHVGIFIDWIEEQEVNGKPKYGEETYNRIITVNNAFINWCIKYGYPIKNYYTEEKMKRVSKDDNPIIEMQELENLFNAITESNKWGMQGKKRVNRLHPWFKDACLFALYTGERYDGVFLTKWSDVRGNFIKIKNWKIFKKTKGQTLRYTYLPISHDLMLLLDKLGYADKIDSDEYILCPDRENRNTIKSLCSKSFTHFWGLSGNTTHKEFRYFRKTFQTRFRLLYGKEADNINRWSGDNIESDHYLNAQKLMEHLTGKPLFTEINEL